MGTVTPSLQLAKKSPLLSVVDLESDASILDHVARWSSAGKPRKVSGAGSAGAGAVGSAVGDYIWVLDHA